MLCATPLILIVFAVLSVLLTLPAELPCYPRVDVHNIASSMLQKLELGHRTMQNILTPETEVLQPEDNLVLEFLDFVISSEAKRKAPRVSKNF